MKEGGEGRWGSAGLGVQKRGGGRDEGESSNRRDGVGDGSKRLSLLTSFSWEAESEGKGRSGVFIQWMQGCSLLMRGWKCAHTLLSDTHTHAHTFLSSFPHSYQIHLDLVPSMQAEHTFTGLGTASFILLPPLILFFLHLISNCSWESILPKVLLMYTEGVDRVEFRLTIVGFSAKPHSFRLSDNEKCLYCRVQLTQNERHSHLWEIQSCSRFSCSSLDCGREPEQLEETWENSTLQGLGVKKVNKLLN